MRSLFVLFLFLSFLAPTVSHADGSLSDGLIHLTESGTSGFRDYEKGEWRWEGPAIVGTTALGSYLFYEFNDQPLGSANEPPKLGEASRVLSDIGLILPLSLPPVFFGLGWISDQGSVERNKSWSTAEQLAEALVFTYGTTGVLKLTVQRTRPNGESNSFPSAHTSSAFAAAGVIAYQYPWYIGVPSLAAAGAIGFSRIDVKAHYASDVVAGAGIGMLFATSVHLFHNGNEFLKSVNSRLTPDFSHGVGLIYSQLF